MGASPAKWAVALDLDGVILDSVESKAKAFLDVFHDQDANTRARIDAYNRANPGVPRSAKMEHIARILSAPPGQMHIWLECYTKLLELSGVPPLIPGARKLFTERAIDLFVCSSAPVAEARARLAFHGLAHFAVGIHGYPVSKVEALSGLAAAYSERLCFVGDADADRQAAQIVGVRFILRSAEQDAGLPGEMVVADLCRYRAWAFG